ncbi:MAG: Plug domain-containing protein [Bacteroidetes bacterium]|nr:Plug domain-containing protein [Bacteroidota bacterium]
MKKLLLFKFFLLLISSVLAQNNNLYLIDRQIITSEDIKKSGITRISDIFSLINNISYSTINGYDYSVSINGLDSYQHQLWKIMLDGQRMDYSIFEDGNINNIPVTLSNIDYIEIYTVPQIIEGEFISSGLMHIHSIIPEDGITVKGKIQVGSETGDPGPFRYTSDNTPNVDNQGTNYSASLGFKKDFFYSILSYKSNTESLTSPAYRKRIQSIAPNIGDIPRLKLNAPSLKAGYITPDTRNEIYITKSEIKDYYFFKPFGREIPLKNKYLHIGATGEFQFQDNYDLSYKIKYSKNNITKIENVFDFDFDWGYENIYGNLQSNIFLKDITLTLGVGINKYTAENESLTINNSFFLGKFYSLISFNYNEFIKQNAGLFLTGNNDKTAYKVYLANEFKINNHNNILIFLSYATNLLEESQNFWYWVDRGYDILDKNDIDYTVQGNLEGGKKLTFDIIYNSEINGKFFLKLKGFYRNFKDMYVEHRDYLYDFTDGSFHSPTVVYTKQNGNAIGGGISIKHNISSKTRHTIFYDFTTSISSDALLNAVWQSIPESRLSYNIIYTPFESFSIFGYLNYTTSTKWIDYKNIDESSGGLYSSKLNSLFTVKVALLKYFWERRFSINLILTNIFDRRNQTHPVGRKSKFAFFLKFEADLLIVDDLF